MNIESTIFDILGSFEHQCKPFKINMKDERLSTSFTTKEKLVATITAVSLAVIVGVGLSFISPVLGTVTGFGVAYTSFSFTSARIKIGKIKDEIPLQILKFNQLEENDRKKAKEDSLNKINAQKLAKAETLEQEIQITHHSFQNQVKQLYAINTEKQAEAYLNEFENHYQAIWANINKLVSLHKKVPGGKPEQARQIEGITSVLSALYSSKEKTVNLKKENLNQKCNRIKTTACADIVARLSGAMERLKSLPSILDFATQQELEALKENWKNDPNAANIKISFVKLDNNGEQLQLNTISI